MRVQNPALTCNTHSISHIAVKNVKKKPGNPHKCWIPGLISYFIKFCEAVNLKSSQNAKFALVTHLLCNFLCKVLLFLLKALTGLETNEALNSDVCTVLFCNLSYVLSYGLLSVLCLYVGLV